MTSDWADDVMIKIPETPAEIKSLGALVKRHANAFEDPEYVLNGRYSIPGTKAGTWYAVKHGKDNKVIEVPEK